jgi:hypothetical protein
MMGKKVKVLEIHADIDDTGVSIGMGFMEDFMEHPVNVRASILIGIMGAFDDFMRDHGSDMLADAHEDTVVREAEEEAAAFLKRCVQNQGGRMH